MRWPRSPSVITDGDIGHELFALLFLGVTGKMWSGETVGKIGQGLTLRRITGSSHALK